MALHLISNIWRGVGERSGSCGNWLMEKIGLITYQMGVYCLLISTWTRKIKITNETYKYLRKTYQDLERNQLGEWDLNRSLLLYKQALDLDNTCLCSPNCCINLPFFYQNVQLQWKGRSSILTLKVFPCRCEQLQLVEFREMQLCYYNGQ